MLPQENISSILEGGFNKIMLLIGVGLLVWAVKTNKVGIASFGPNDRGFRESWGKPGWVLKQGPHPHMLGLGTIKQASIAVSSVTLNKIVVFEKKKYLVEATFYYRNIDTKEMLLRAIYNTFDENKQNQYNAQRNAYIRGKLEAAIWDITISSEHVKPSFSLDSFNQYCKSDLEDQCGTELTSVAFAGMVLVDAEILKSGLIAGPDDGASINRAGVIASVISLETHDAS